MVRVLQSDIFICKIELQGNCWKWIPFLLHLKSERICGFRVGKAAELTKQKLYLIIKYLWNLPESENLNHGAWEKQDVMLECSRKHKMEQNA